MPAVVTPMPKRRRGQDPWDHVLEQIANLHDCVHSVGGKVDEVGSRVGELGERVAKVEGYQQGIATRIGVPLEGEKPKNPIGFMGRGKAFWGLAATIFGALTAFATAYPWIAGLARAFHEALLLGN